ncbi:MAG: EAL domain-containing protein [Gammaproteobacteria bacterium]|nr:EAL domain-containing protein [Gammaproteobacteria bacterium]
MKTQVKLNRIPPEFKDERDIVGAGRLNQLLHLQLTILGSIAGGCSSASIFEELCRMIETIVPDSLASVMLLNKETGQLVLQAGPSFPREALPYFQTLVPGVDMGSCGNAAFSGEPVFVTNAPGDVRWNGLREAARRFNIGACWSMPILSDDKRVLGTFAITSFESCSPEPFHRRILETASHVAAITIKNQQREQRLLQWRTVFNDASEGMFVTSANGSILDANKAFTRITGYGLKEVRGKNPRMLRSERHDEDFYQAMWASINVTGKWQGEIWNRRKNGEVYPQWVSISRISNHHDESFNYVAVFSDISSLKESEHKLFQLAHHDPLTGLPNRLLMNARLEHIVAQAKRNPTGFALMFIDLDRFKNVNDSYGHALGDQLLIEVAERLRVKSREQDTIARIGGDEFVIILERLYSSEDAASLAEKFIETLDHPFRIDEKEIFITPSIGITLFPDDGTTPEVLLKNADIAMYRAKEQGRHGYSFYTSSMTAQVKERLSLETHLRRALQRNQFELYYQPQLVAKDSGIVGVEALLRWHHPELGMLLPGQFISILEETHLIQEVGEWALIEACRQVNEWDQEGLPRIRLAVNLSAKQMFPASVSQRLGTILQSHGLGHGRLELEITEHSLMEEDEGTTAMLDSLQDLGISLAIDDFGSGHSSLTRLKRLPVHCLKIDRTLVKDIATDSDDQAICQAVVALGHSLGMRVLAEGVETREQSDLLQSIACDEQQGFLHGRPVPARVLRQMLLQQQRQGPATAVP